MPEGLEDPVKSNLLPVLPEDVPLTVALIFGTRPEAIKMAPLIRRLGHHPARFKPITIVTAQHRSMLDQVLELFSISPDFDLNVIQPRQSLAKIVARAVPELDSILKRIKPHFVIVQGDTSTTFIGALAAFYNHFPVAHVEAGLRTHKKYYPFPEEINRHLTSVLSDIHFAPTIESKQNLINEGISPGKIWITGNTVIDALQDILSWGENCAHPVLKRIAKNQCRMVFVTSHRRENQGKPQEQICLALLELVRKFRDMLIVFPVHLSPSVREIIMPALRQQDRVVLLDPIDYFETVHFMKAAHLILTDSGGIQEEGPALGKPVLVLRDETERPEGVAAGTVRLVGTNPINIVEAVSDLFSDDRSYRKMAEAVNPYGDGFASERILQVLELLTGRGPAPEPFNPSRNN